MREASRLSTRLEGALRDRGILSKLLLVVASIGGLLIAVEGWEAAFPYRLGDHIPHGIISRTQFVQVDRLETEQRRREEADRVPLVFSRSQFRIEALSAQLRSYLQDIDEANSFSDLPSETQQAFHLQLNSAGSSDVQTEVASLEAEFASIKAVVSADVSSGNRIETIIDDFESFLEPVSELGLADPDLQYQPDILPETPIFVVKDKNELPTLDGLEHTPYVLKDVLLRQQLENSGRLGSSWSQYSLLQQIRTQLKNWLESQASEAVSLKLEPELTEDFRELAREKVEPQGRDIKPGAILVPAGSVLGPDQLDLLKSEFAAYREKVGPRAMWLRAVTVFVMLSILAGLFAYYLATQERRLVGNFYRLTVYLLLSVVSVYLARHLSNDPWRAEVIPLLAMTMIVAIAFNQMLATITALLLSLLVTLSTVQDLGHFVVLGSVTVAASICLTVVSSRTTLIKVGLLCGTLFFLLTWGVGAIRAQSLLDLSTDWEMLMASLRGAGWCLVAGYLVAGSLPFVESSFGVVTDISLLEMSDISHPLLQELVRRAPGTYNHSIAVATVGEAAADAIGANGLLVRVGAYFHDIGKMIKPEYFVENMSESDRSRHEHLNPAMSTLIIIGHVKDGVDLARQHHLPQAIIDFIEQHHGTTLVEYFFREAEKKADEHQSGDVEEASFRYPGPKPQSRESGVMMIADAVESATRTLVEPTPKRIESLVDRLLMKRLLDGQFDESKLTLTELHTVKDSLVKSLIAIHHGRIKYPDQKTA